MPEVMRQKKRTVEDGGFRIPGPEDIQSPPEDFMQYCTVIYGAKGIGKSSLMGAIPGSLTISLEPRRRTVRARVLQVRPMSMAETVDNDSEKTTWWYIKAAVKQALADKTVSAICVDTIDQAYSACLIDFCYAAGITHPNDANDYGKSWSLMRGEFVKLFSEILYHEGRDVGLFFTSHAKPASEEGEDDEQPEYRVVPSCDRWSWNYLRQATDFAFYFRYYNQDQRWLDIRAGQRAWTGCATDNHFMSPKGEPLVAIPMGATPEQGYQNLLAAFDNTLKTGAVTPIVRKKKTSNQKE